MPVDISSRSHFRGDRPRGSVDPARRSRRIFRRRHPAFAADTDDPSGRSPYVCRSKEVPPLNTAGLKIVR